MAAPDSGRVHGDGVATGAGGVKDGHRPAQVLDERRRIPASPNAEHAFVAGGRAVVQEAAHPGRRRPEVVAARRRVDE